MLAREMFLVMGGGSGSIPRAYQGAVELGFYLLRPGVEGQTGGSCKSGYPETQ